MKYIITLLWLQFFSICSNGQDTIFFDSNWKESLPKGAIFYRIIKKDKDKNWVVRDSWASGEIQMTGTYKDKKLQKKTGDFVYYYQNGSKKSSVTYRENSKNGLFQSWYPDGGIHSKGSYIEGKRHEVWTWYHQNGVKSAEENFYYDVVKEFTFWDSLGNLIENPQYQIEPSFVGGEYEMIQFIRGNLVYPKEAVDKGITGISFISFVVNEDGTINNITVSKSSDALLDKAAIDVIELMPLWIPGMQHNEFVKVRYTLPVQFNLENTKFKD